MGDFGILIIGVVDTFFAFFVVAPMMLLAASLCRRAHLYLWDEPLNYIDLLSRQQLEQLLLEFAPTMVFVEHDELFCRNVATEMVPL